MIVERFPQLSELNPQEQLLLAGELMTQAKEDNDPVHLPENVVRLLEERLDHYLGNPDSGVSWEELRKTASEGN